MTTVAVQDLAKLLVRYPEIELRTQIFQAYVGETGDGVCRGIIVGWIASYLDSLKSADPGPLQTYRKKLSNLKNSASQFVALQGDYKFHKGKSHSTAEFTTILSMRRAVGRLENANVPAQAIFSVARNYFGNKGIYFIGLPGHAVCVVNSLGSYSFVDPNTGEFVCRDINLLEQFLGDYYRHFVMGTNQDGPIAYTIHYPA
jgi:hypothetical protein